MSASKIPNNDDVYSVIASVRGLLTDRYII